MYKFIVSSYSFFFFIFGYWCVDNFRQEGARLVYVNEKYMKDVVVFTARKSRHEPYKTNMTGTVLVPFGNNVTIEVRLQMKSGGDFRVAFKACQGLNKVKWSRDFTLKHTNVSLDRCPIPPNRYSYYNMELPPKNIPVPMADGDYNIFFEIYLTSTKEKILQNVATLHYDQSSRKASKQG